MLLLWLHFPISLLSQPFLSLSPKLFSPLLLLTFPFISLFSFSCLACLTFLDLFSPLPIFLSLLFPFLSSSIVALSISLLLLPLARLSIFVLSSLFVFPLSASPVPRVQELTLASLTCPLLGALRAAIGIKYSFISFITFILIRFSLNKSLIEPYY